ncbi:MAG TPA: metal-sulfur cluster assembly factor [Vitreimonas sp.]|nr:metal-sulfur cluster assembly factor [Vitreimonas sp.]
MADPHIQTLNTTLTSDLITTHLKTVMDPELNVDIVSLGLVYDVSVKEVQSPGGPHPLIHILLTLTTPGCPLAAVFEPMIKSALKPLETSHHVDTDQDVIIELTFDPPWVPDMMTAEARAELGFD